MSWKDINCRKCVYRVRDSRITKDGEPFIKEELTQAYYCLITGKARFMKKLDCYVFVEGEPLIDQIRQLREDMRKIS